MTWVLIQVDQTPVRALHHQLINQLTMISLTKAMVMTTSSLVPAATIKSRKISANIDRSSTRLVMTPTMMTIIPDPLAIKILKLLTGEEVGVEPTIFQILLIVDLAHP